MIVWFGSDEELDVAWGVARRTMREEMKKNKEHVRRHRRKRREREHFLVVATTAFVTRVRAAATTAITVTRRGFPFLSFFSFANLCLRAFVDLRR